MSFDATFLFVLLSFVVFTLLMKAVFFDPIRGIKQARQDHQTQAEAQAQEYAQARLKLEEAYEQGLQEARKKAQALIMEARERMKAEVAELISRTQKEVQSTLDAKLRDLAAWQESTYQQLETERKALADRILESAFPYLGVANRLVTSGNSGGKG